MSDADLDQTTPRPDYSATDVLYTYYGHTAYWAQLFELEMLNLVAALRLAELDPIDATNYASAFRNLGRQTLGALLKRCRDKQSLYLSEEQEALLRQAMDRRNYLVHRFFSVHDAELTEDPRPLVDELRQLAALLAAANTVAQNAAFSILAALDADYKLTELILKHGLAWENVIMEAPEQVP